ncbi:TatD family hydrolase [Bacillus sp. SORGH_AS_0510]|uniref:TatD family hydrolase n=1 Tax=Bacillus sp. SORGH_AS_0510 TaxID=3041771 RepID=UPI0035944833
MLRMIDAHIHLDQYSEQELTTLMEDSQSIDALVTVSNHLTSCKRNLQLSQTFHKVKPAFGFHPEQPLPTDEEKSDLFTWIDAHRDEMVAIGEVGLPYYQRLDNKITSSQYEQYVEFVEAFIKLAKKNDKPIVLHAVYEDASVVCDLLEKHSIGKAHFHWFKGDRKTITRMMRNGYFISVTPDVVYKKEIQDIVVNVPIERLMVETDGPWRFKGPFLGQMTHPNMMQHSISKIASIKNRKSTEVGDILLQNTRDFYAI